MINAVHRIFGIGGAPNQASQSLHTEEALFQLRLCAALPRPSIVKAMDLQVYPFVPKITLKPPTNLQRSITKNNPSSHYHSISLPFNLHCNNIHSLTTTPPPLKSAHSPFKSLLMKGPQARKLESSNLD